MPRVLEMVTCEKCLMVVPDYKIELDCREHLRIEPQRTFHWYSIDEEAYFAVIGRLEYRDSKISRYLRIMNDRGWV